MTDTEQTTATARAPENADAIEPLRKIQRELSEPARRVRHHRVMLIISALVFVLAGLLVVLPGEEKIAFRGMEDAPLPESCLARNYLGGGCPGCGLTRSTIYFVQGRIADSLRMHRVGWIMVIVIAFQIPYRGYGLWKQIPYPLGRTFATWATYGVIAMLILNWLIKVLVG